MNLLDWLLVVLVLTYALSGYWQGFITGAFATAGLLLGGLVGVWLAPVALGDADPSVLVSLGALFIVILCASLGQAGLQFAGARIRDKITWQPVRAVDAIGGAALSAAAVLIVAWALGVAISGSGIAGITGLVRSSAVLGKVDQVLPSSADSALGAFNDVVGSGFFPQYLDPFAPERIIKVDPGPKRLLSTKFADIFRGNAGKQGLVTGVVTEDVLEAIWAALEAEPGREVTVDLETRTVQVGDVQAPFDIDDYTRWRLLEGLDDIGLTLRSEDKIAQFEARREAWRPRTLPVR